VKYYFYLVILFFSLIGLEIFFANLFPRMTIPLVLSFLIAFAFFTPSKTRYPYNAVVPVALISAFAGDAVSSLPSGVVFFVYIVMSLLTVNLAVNVPREKDVKILMLLSVLFILASRIVFVIWIRNPGLLLSRTFMLHSFGTAIIGSVFVVMFYFVLNNSLEWLTKTLLAEDK